VGKRRSGSRTWQPKDAPAIMAALARVLSTDAPPITEVPFSLSAETAEGPTAAPVALPFENGKRDKD
jgi:hypothetical protein